MTTNEYKSCYDKTANELDEDIRKLKQAKKELNKYKKTRFLIRWGAISLIVGTLNNKFEKGIGYQYDLFNSPTYKEYTYDIVDNEVVNKKTDITKYKSEKGQNFITVTETKDDKTIRSIYSPDELSIDDIIKLVNKDTSFLENITPNAKTIIADTPSKKSIDAHVVSIDEDDYKLTQITTNQQEEKLNRIGLGLFTTFVASMLAGAALKELRAKLLLKKYGLNKKLNGGFKYAIDDATINDLETKRNNIRYIKNIH